MKSECKLLLFDLGGVLVENKGFSLVQKWVGDYRTQDEFWGQWLSSETVKRFESGFISAHEFAEGVVKEFSFPVTSKEFIQEFSGWPLGYYAGATEFLKKCRTGFKIACLSNTNRIHWDVTISSLNVIEMFDYCFASHQMGCVKPDREIYDAVISKVPFKASEILFFDDNMVNVDGAAAAGIESVCVKGFPQLKEYFNMNRNRFGKIFTN
jgi:glucose-1-phosphatase